MNKKPEPEHIIEFQRRVDEHRWRQGVYKKYNTHYNNELYLAATRGKSNRYANMLIDYGLALCGDSYYRMPTNPRLSKEAIAFLDEFIKGDCDV